MSEVSHLRAEPERYLTRRQLASALSVGLNTVDRFVREGCPSYVWGKQTRRFRLSEVERWLRENKRGTIAA